MPFKLKVKEGNTDKEYSVYSKQEIDRLASGGSVGRGVGLSSRTTSRLTTGGSGGGGASAYINKRFNEFYNSLESVGETTQDLSGTQSTVPSKLKGQITSGTDYYIINEDERDFYTITPTVNIGPGNVDVSIQEQIIEAPSGSRITKVPGQDEAKQQKLDETQGDLDDRLVTLDGYIDDPSTIPADYTFFEGIVSNAIWAESVTAMEGWFDNIFANTLMVDRITANEIDADTITASEIAVGTITANEINTNDLATNQAFVDDLYTVDATIAATLSVGGTISAGGATIDSSGVELQGGGEGKLGVFIDDALKWSIRNNPGSADKSGLMATYELSNGEQILWLVGGYDDSANTGTGEIRLEAENIRFIVDAAVRMEDKSGNLIASLNDGWLNLTYSGGVATPSNGARIYLNGGNGDLEVVFANGTTRTIATN